jgi:hypothetical protein
MKTFRIAPMSALFVLLFVPLMAMPILFLMVDAGPATLVMQGTGGFVLAIYGSVWAWWRPTRFDVDRSGLTAVFPTRRRHTPRAEIVSAELLDMGGFRRQYPRAMRVGAGGLGGGFGWLWSKNGWIEFYISRMDGLVLIQRRGRMPLLISPRDPEGFVAALDV